MTQRPWFATYSECGIPAEINPDAHRSVVHMLEQAMKKYADKPAFRSFGQTSTYADVDRQSRNFAAYLQKKFGVKKRLKTMITARAMRGQKILLRVRACIHAMFTSPPRWFA